ncbi:MAG: DNA mismatch repair protein MutS [Parachlamydiales bacterium]|nr:DNA mismatch repair protein MutS [Parachlamydiales bacterium]
MSCTTPMMKQWKDLKEQAKDALLLFRLGDFYEAFFEDAKLISKLLDLTLTKRQNIPMCGVPHHTCEVYVDRLIAKGYKIAIAEQTEDPKNVKGIVKREISKILSPATIINSNLLEEKSNNYFLSINQIGLTFGLGVLDFSTSEFYVLEIEDQKELLNEILKIKPKEILVSQKFKKQNFEFLEKLSYEITFLLTEKDDWYFDFDMAYEKLINQFKVHSLDSFGLNGMTAAINACGGLISYLTEDLLINLDHIKKIKKENFSSSMIIDYTTMKNLEIIESNNHINKDNTLLDLLDKTKTAMGGRLLKKWLKLPLIDIDEINKRLFSVEETVNNFEIFLQVQENLNNIKDLERILMRLINNSATPRDLSALKISLEFVPIIKDFLKDFKSELISQDVKNLKDVKNPLLNLLTSAIVENPPIRLNEGGIFKDGYNSELDELRLISTNGSLWINQYQQRLREETKIKTLKVGFTKAFGYFIDVSRGQSDNVPECFLRKQTLVNNERYITEELKEFESKVLTAEEKIKLLENKLFYELREKILQNSSDIEKIASALARIDVIFSFARAAKAFNYTKPNINNSDIINIVDGRHPIIEASSSTGQFIPNDTYLNNSDNQLFLITGPNMAGKSTYIRQVAILVIMAQIGSFVPAKKADIGIVDKVFSRIGASDDLSRGQSTFMVEMTETANILNNATKKSLIILDEIGRGTSTYDGISIAWAVAEYLLTTQEKKAKTLFATHYFELTELENILQGAVNYNVAVKETDSGIVFLRKILKGSTDRSYGIHVAKLAGLPYFVIKKAEERLFSLENEMSKNEPSKKAAFKKQNKQDQFMLFDINESLNKKIKNLINELKAIDVNKLTPIEALQKIFNLKQNLDK